MYINYDVQKCLSNWQNQRAGSTWLGFSSKVKSFKMAFKEMTGVDLWTALSIFGAA